MHLKADCNPFQRLQRAGTISACSLCCTPEHQCLLGGGALHVSGALVFISIALFSAAAHPGMPLDHLALVGRGAFIPGSHRTLPI